MSKFTVTYRSIGYAPETFTLDGLTEDEHDIERNDWNGDIEYVIESN